MNFRDIIIVPKRLIEFELERMENSQSGGRSETRTRMLVLTFFRVGFVACKRTDVARAQDYDQVPQGLVQIL